MKDWTQYKNEIEQLVRTTLTRLKESSVPLNLYFQKYQSHPFIDIYAVECSKSVGFDQALSEISGTGSNNQALISQDVLYLGDSENDNPAFKKAGFSIGVKSDSKLNPKLECQHTIVFDQLSLFLKRLKHNNLIFQDNLLASD